MNTIKQIILSGSIVAMCVLAAACNSAQKDNTEEKETEKKELTAKEAIDTLAVVDYALSEEEATKINQQFLMEDYDGANLTVATMITMNHQNLPLFERVWKAAARSYVQNNDMKGLTRLINTISAYNIPNAPIGMEFSEWGAKQFVGHESLWSEYVEDYRIYKTGEIAKDETARFNSVIDDLFDIALQNKNKEMAKMILELYRADIVEVGDGDTNVWRTCESSKEAKARELK